MFTELLPRNSLSKSVAIYLMFGLAVLVYDQEENGNIG
jgi:hypothetical protein